MRTYWVHPAMGANSLMPHPMEQKMRKGFAIRPKMDHHPFLGDEPFFFHGQTVAGVWVRSSPRPSDRRFASQTTVPFAVAPSLRGEDATRDDPGGWQQ